MSLFEKFLSFVAESPYDIFVVSQPDLNQFLRGQYSFHDEFWFSKKEWKGFSTSMGYPAAILDLPQQTIQTRAELKEWVLKQSFNDSIRIGFDSVTSYKQVEAWKKDFEGSSVVFEGNGTFCHVFRIQKSANEMRKLFRAAHLACAGFRHAIRFLRPGITEEEVVGLMYTFWLQQEPSARPAFDVMVLFGENASSPHNLPGKKSLQIGDVVLVDCGVRLDGFCSDLTRTFSFGEPRDPEFFSVWRTVAEAKREATSLFKKRTAAAFFQESAKKVINEAGYGKYFIHSLGHGIGTLIHELPNFTGQDPLLVDSCVTVEPGIYLPGRFGVRLEDTFLVAQSGALLMTDLPVYPYWEWYLRG